MRQLTRRRLLACAASAGVLTSCASGAEFTWHYANNVSADHPMSRYMATLARDLEEATAGRLRIGVFPNSQLGSELDMLTQLRTGAIELYSMSGILLSALVPGAAITGIGFAFPDYPGVWRTLDGPLGIQVRREIERHDMVVFDRVWNGGFRQVTSSTRAIRTPGDLKGFKIRVPVSALWTRMFSALGGSPVGLNFGEVYAALQTRVVDGQETSLISIEASKLYEVQRYCALTRHMWDGFWLLGNPAAWRALPPSMRELVASRVEAVTVQQRQEVESRSEVLQPVLASRGLVFNDVDLAEFRRALRKAGFYAEWRARLGVPLWRLLEDSLGHALA